jgi:hypothetical protein
MLNSQYSPLFSSNNSLFLCILYALITYKQVFIYVGYITSINILIIISLYSYAYIPGHILRTEYR